MDSCDSHEAANRPIQWDADEDSMKTVAEIADDFCDDVVTSGYRPTRYIVIIIIIIIVVYYELSKRNWTIKGKNRDKIKTSTCL